MLHAVVARHRCVSHYHAETGTAVSIFDEATLSLGGSFEAVNEIVRIEIDGVSFAVDPVRKTISHPEHSDPAVPFQFNGKWWLQVFLCDGRYRTKLPSQVRAWTADAACVVGRVEEHEPSDAAEIKSRLFGSPGNKVLEFESSARTQVFRQTSSCGLEAESLVGMYGPGSHLLDISPVHSERYGICISSRDEFGGIEHKHMIHGQGGHASGRILMAATGTWWPKVREQFAYRSVIAVDDGGDWIDNVIRDPKIDEVEVWTTVSRAAVVERMISTGILKGRKVTTYEARASLDATKAQTLILDPDDDIPYGKTISYMLFHDQSEAGFSDRLEASLKRIGSIPQSIPVIERAWLGSRDLPSMTKPHYGIGFSRSAETMPTAKINLFKRLGVPTFDPCGRCEVRNDCLSLMATPLVGSLLPKGNTCAIRSALENQDALKSALDSETRSSTMRAAASVA